jgi:hypothetical protein
MVSTIKTPKDCSLSGYVAVKRFRLVDRPVTDLAMAQIYHRGSIFIGGIQENIRWFGENLGKKKPPSFEEWWLE